MAVSLGTPQRIAALLIVALMIVAPLLWIVWSLTAATATAAANRDLSETLATMQARLTALTAGSNADLASAASVYLPGKSAAIAGAALQRLVANAVEGASGRVVQSEIARSDAAEEEPGIVKLRAEFETDIIGLQQIVFKIETGAPILMVEAVTIESKNVDSAEAMNPGLSVVLLIRGRWEA